MSVCGTGILKMLSDAVIPRNCTRSTNNSSWLEGPHCRLHILHWLYDIVVGVTGDLMHEGWLKTKFVLKPEWAFYKAGKGLF